MKILGNGLVPESVTLGDFKSAVPMAEAPEFDLAIGALLRAATDTVEAATRRPMAPRKVELRPPVGNGCWSRWWFPVAPVVQIDEVAVWTGSAWQALAASDYSLEMAHDEPQLVLIAAVREIHGDAAIRVQAEVGAMPINERQRQAVILIAQEWHLAGAGMGDASVEVNSFAAHALIRQVRYIRPGIVE